MGCDNLRDNKIGYEGNKAIAKSLKLLPINLASLSLNLL